MKQDSKAIAFAILAAALYALSAPISKILLEEVQSTFMAALLYLGAGVGIAIMGKAMHLSEKSGEKGLTRKEFPYVISMVVLDIAAPILLMLGLTRTSSANASLLNNFEIVATSIIALVVFKEAISKRLWFAIALVTLSSIILSFESMESLEFSWGSALILLACVCWGFENNCTRMLSCKDPLQIVVIKGLGSGLGSLAISLALGQWCTNALYIAIALVLGFFSYGLSIYFYVYAQRYLGAAKTSAFYAFSPFIGVALSLVIFQERPTTSFLVALAIMLIGSYLAAEK